MLILDLASESYSIYPRYQSYFGQPFIWCMLHNFGGSVQMYGMIEAVNQVEWAIQKASIHGQAPLAVPLTGGRDNTQG